MKTIAAAVEASRADRVGASESEDAAIEAADRYYPAFDFMVRGSKKPKEAIDACLFETVGNA